MRGKSDGDLVVLSGWKAYKDDLISLETFLKIIENLKDNEKERIEELRKADQEIITEKFHEQNQNILKGEESNSFVE